MSGWALFFLAFATLVLAGILRGWWLKFVRNRPDLYGRGPGHELRGAERGNWVRVRDE